jgi:hypothetical protein
MLCGIIGHSKNCEAVLSTLCRFSIPPGVNSNRPSDPGNPQEVTSILRVFHVQSFARLSQAIHVLAERISDWDMIVDCYEQMTAYLVSSSVSNRMNVLAKSSSTAVVSGGVQGPSLSAGAAPVSWLFCEPEVSPADILRILKIMERFKQYSLFLCDDTLVHLMTSLVSLSINTLSAVSLSFPVAGNSNSGASINSAVESSSGHNASLLVTAAGAKRASMSVASSSAISSNNSSTAALTNSSSNASSAESSGISSIDIADILNSRVHDGTLSLPKYMAAGYLTGVVRFSFSAAVEIAKLNAHRISCVWQMLTTHLKMLASTKVHMSHE